MSIYEWYNLNELRSYPIDDTLVSPVPESLIADLCLRWPSSLGETAFIGSVSATASLITIVFQVGSTAIASVAVRKADISYAPVQLEGLAAGAGGWVVIGADAGELDFSLTGAEATTALVPGVAASYPVSGVLGVGITTDDTPLTGLVDITSGIGVEIYGADEDFVLVGDDPDYASNPTRKRIYDGVQTEGIVIRLDASAGNYDTLLELAGDCAGFPDTSCDRPPIRRINSVGPDCDGNITVEIVGVPDRYVVRDGIVSGQIVDYFFGTDLVCARNPMRRYVSGDLCEDEVSSDLSSEVPEPSSSDIPSSVVPGCDVAYPFVELYDDSDLSCYTTTGTWAVNGCILDGLWDDGSPGTAVRKNTDTLGRTITGYVEGAADLSGGLLFGALGVEYSFLRLNADFNTVELGRRSLQNTTIYGTAAQTIIPGRWYKLAVELVQNGLSSSVVVYVDDVQKFVLAKMPVLNGGVGFVTFNTFAGFDGLSIDDDLSLTSLEHGCP